MQPNLHWHRHAGPKAYNSKLCHRIGLLLVVGFPRLRIVTLVQYAITLGAVISWGEQAPLERLPKQASTRQSISLRMLHKHTSEEAAAAGIMWPLINDKKGEWFPEKYGQPSNNIRGIYAYKVFIGLGFILGDGLYNILKLFVVTARDV